MCVCGGGGCQNPVILLWYIPVLWHIIARTITNVQQCVQGVLYLWKYLAMLGLFAKRRLHISTANNAVFVRQTT